MENRRANGGLVRFQPLRFHFRRLRLVSGGGLGAQPSARTRSRLDLADATDWLGTRLPRTVPGAGAQCGVNVRAAWAGGNQLARLWASRAGTTALGKCYRRALAGLTRLWHDNCSTAGPWCLPRAVPVVGERFGPVDLTNSWRNSFDETLDCLGADVRRYVFVLVGLRRQSQHNDEVDHLDAGRHEDG
jgi:hypothetical protein